MVQNVQVIMPMRLQATTTATQTPLWMARTGSQRCALLPIWVAGVGVDKTLLVPPGWISEFGGLTQEVHGELSTTDDVLSALALYPR